MVLNGCPVGLSRLRLAYVTCLPFGSLGEAAAVNLFCSQFHSRFGCLRFFPLAAMVVAAATTVEFNSGLA